MWICRLPDFRIHGTRFVLDYVSLISPWSGARCYPPSLKPPKYHRKRDIGGREVGAARSVKHRHFEIQFALK